MSVVLSTRILRHKPTLTVSTSCWISLLIADVAATIEVGALPYGFCDELFEVGLVCLAHHLTVFSRDGWYEIELSALMIVLEPSRSERASWLEIGWVKLGL